MRYVKRLNLFPLWIRCDSFRRRDPNSDLYSIFYTVIELRIPMFPPSCFPMHRAKLTRETAVNDASCIAKNGSGTRIRRESSMMYGSFPLSHRCALADCQSPLLRHSFLERAVVPIFHLRNRDVCHRRGKFYRIFGDSLIINDYTNQIVVICNTFWKHNIKCITFFEIYLLFIWSKICRKSIETRWKKGYRILTFYVKSCANTITLEKL